MSTRTTQAFAGTLIIILTMKNFTLAIHVNIPVGPNNANTALKYMKFNFRNESMESAKVWAIMVDEQSQKTDHLINIAQILEFESNLRASEMSETINMNAGELQPAGLETQSKLCNELYSPNVKGICKDYFQISSGDAINKVWQEYGTLKNIEDDDR
jgi:hypothetical protein